MRDVGKRSTCASRIDDGLRPRTEKMTRKRLVHSRWRACSSKRYGGRLTRGEHIELRWCSLLVSRIPGGHEAAATDKDALISFCIALLLLFLFSDRVNAALDLSSSPPPRLAIIQHSATMVICPPRQEVLDLSLADITGRSWCTRSDVFHRSGANFAVD